MSLNLKAPAKEHVGVTRRLVLVAFEKNSNQKFCRFAIHLSLSGIDITSLEIQIFKIQDGLEFVVVKLSVWKDLILGFSHYVCNVILIF